MKVTIVYASAGAGHFKAAQAIYNYIRKRCPQIDVKLVDVIEKSNLLFQISYRWGYSFLVRCLTFVWGFVFWLTEFRILRNFSRKISTLINALSTRELARFLIQENNDFIISTHFLSSEISAKLKKSNFITSKLITVITDFGVHPFWISDGTDMYIVASSFARGQLLAEGVLAENIREYGIPTDEKFLQNYDRKELCGKLNIENRFTVLVMTGSFGIGPLEEIACALHKDVQVLVVCAANKRLYRRLKDRNLPGVHVFGFIDNAHELMAASDVIITKPGGLTISEILNMGLVPLFISTIPGQETNNARVLEGYGIGLNLKDAKEIKNTVLDYRNHPDKLKSIQEKIKSFRKSGCLGEICNVVCQGSSGPGGERAL